MNTDKQQVHDFWNEAPCGESLYLQGAGRARLLSLARKIWPRAFLKRFFPMLGLFMLVEARK